MIVFLYIFFIVSFFANTLNTSLLPTKKLRVYASLLPCFICVCFYTFSLSQNNQFIEWISSQPNLISGIALVQTFEALLFIFISLVQIQSYYGAKFPSLWKWFSFIPSFQLVLGLIFFQTIVFIKIDGYNFELLALLFFIISFLSIFGTSQLTTVVFRQWSNRAELKSLLLIFQVLLAMFLPLVAKGLKLTHTQITIDITSVALTICILISFGAYGFYTYKTNNGTL